MTEVQPDRLTIACSTLACPEWSADEVVDRVSAMGYDAIEWRGGPEGHVRADWSASRRADLRRRVEDAGLTSLAVTSYTQFVSGDARARQDSIEHLERHLELAADLGAPYVRAFLGEVDDPAPTSEHLHRAIEGLSAALSTARAVGVDIAIEPHDDFARAASLRPVLDRLDAGVVGVVWDVVNAWGMGELPRTGHDEIRGRIRYVQLKDARWADGEWQLTPIGEGQVPLLDAMRALAADGPLPPLSVEWERAWHPELAPADVALPRALEAVRDLVGHSRASLDSATSTPTSSSSDATTSAADTRLGNRNSSSTS
jgi:sugar phosphate isomerase/epimerase